MAFLNSQHTKSLLTLALPVMLTQVGQVSVNLFDNIIVGKLLGAQALASVSLGNAVFFSIFVFALGFSLAIPPLVSEAHSVNDHETINSVFRHGFVINLGIGLLLSIVLLLALPLLYHMNQPPEIIPDTISFLAIMTISILPFMVFQTLRERNVRFSANGRKRFRAGEPNRKFFHDGFPLLRFAEGRNNSTLYQSFLPAN